MTNSEQKSEDTTYEYAWSPKTIFDNILKYNIYPKNTGTNMAKILWKIRQNR